MKLIKFILVIFIFSLTPEIYAEAICKNCNNYLPNGSECIQAPHGEDGTTICSGGWKCDHGQGSVTVNTTTLKEPMSSECQACISWQTIQNPFFDSIEHCLTYYNCYETTQEPIAHCHVGSINCSSYNPPGSPILINLAVGKWDISGFENSIPFKMYEEIINYTWPLGKLAFLVQERDGKPGVTSGQDLYGDWTPKLEDRENNNGFTFLNADDTNQDGFVDSEDEFAWSRIKIWLDNSPRDGISQDHELISISETGIEWISTKYHMTGRKDIDGNEYKYQGLIKINGKVEPIYDIYFRAVN